MSRRNFKSQLSIFILLAVFVIILIAFLLAMTLEDEQRDISNTLENDAGQSDAYESLKEEVDFCLLRSLRKATIISGYLGGYIYTDSLNTGENERYSDSVSFDQYYTGNFLEDLNINSGYLFGNTLYYHTYDVHSPPFDEGSVIKNSDDETTYGRGIEDDYQRYIREEFSSCIDFSKYEDAGFSINNLDISGEYSGYENSQEARISNFDAELGDTISMRVGSKRYEGEVKEDISEDVFKVDFGEDLFPVTGTIDSITNEDLAIDIDVSFQEESVSAELHFPVSLSDNEDQEISSITSSETLNVRFLKLQDTMEVLLQEKKENKSMDYSDESVVEDVLNEHSNYFSSLSEPGLKFHKSTIEDTPEYKQYIYTLSDSQQRIQNQEYVFNVAYQNHVPILDLSEIGCVNIDSSYEVGEDSTNSCVLIVPPDTTIDKDLAEVVTDKQNIDSFQTRFAEQRESSNIFFEITSDGELSFRSSEQGVYEREIELSDGEAKREYQFEFVVGAPGNENNEDAKGCISFKNSHQQSEQFPINNDLENAKFSGSSGDKKIPFGYGLNNATSDPTISVNDYCFDSRADLQMKYEIKDDSGSIIKESSISSLSDSFDVPLTSEDSPYYEVSINVTDSSGSSFITKPFEFVVYSMGCLGPNDREVLDSDGDPYTTIGTCCDMEGITNHYESDTHPQSIPDMPLASKDGEKVLDVTLSFGIASIGNIDHAITDDDKETPIIKEDNVWEYTDMGVDISSHYKGDVSATCKGDYPKAINNLDPITSSTNDKSGMISHVINEGGDGVKIGKEFNFKEVKSGQVCGELNFSGSRSLLQFNTTNGVIFSGAPNADIIPVSRNPPSSEEDLYLCNDEWFGSNESSSIWQSSGFDWVDEDVTRSQEYCTTNSFSCGRYDVEKRVEGSFCEPARFDGTNLSTSDSIRNGEECDRDITSINSTHEEVEVYECDSGDCTFDRDFEREK